MELTPQSRSPGSPFRYNPTSQPVYEYPSPAQSDSQYRSTESVQGLGLYSCPMSESSVVDGGSVTQPASATTNWCSTTNTPRSPQSTPNILSAEYDPFYSIPPAVSAPYSHDIYGPHTAEVLVLPASPAQSSNTSQRSSLSSVPTSDIFTQAGSIQSYTPRVKMEDHVDYVTGPGGMMMSSPQNLLITSASSYPASLDTSFYHDQHQISWPKIDYGVSHELPSISSLPIPPFDRRPETQDQAKPHEKRKPSSTIARTRQPRKLTTKEGANFQCSIKGCGKLFGRSYNFKAHMETHDVGREYPFPCPMKACTKKFVRKTDLQRHHQSVHMKQRNHRCDYCSRYFARKDTLRRHMEDGCSKRFDIEMVDFRPQIFGTEEQNDMNPAVSRTAEHQSRQLSYSSTAPFSPPQNTTSQDPHSSPLMSAQVPFSDRQDYLTGDNAQDPIWPN